MTVKKKLDYIQQVYDKYFSFLELDKFSCDWGLLLFESVYHINTGITIDAQEITEHTGIKKNMKHLIQQRLLDTLYSAQIQIDENIKRIKETK